MKMAYSRSGFTLIEMLIVLAVIAILAAITIAAISPSRQISSAKSAKHDSNTRALHNAVSEYIIDNWTLPDATIPVGSANALPICKYGATASGCVSLDPLIPEYLVSIPDDPDEPNPLFSGYMIFQDDTGQMRVTVPFD